MQDYENVVSVGTVDRSEEHVADVEVDVAGTVGGETIDVLLVVVVVVEFAGALAVAAVAAVNAVDAISVDVATAADFELGVLDVLPDYPT